MMGRTPDKQRAGAEVWMEFIHPDDRDSVRAAFRNAVAGGRDTYQSELRLQHLDGHYINVLGRGHVLRNAQGKPIRTSGTNLDLTEQRQAQSQIRLLQSCVESLQDMVIVTLASPGNSPGPMIAYVNPAFEAFTGFSRDEVMGKSPRMLQGPLTGRDALEKIAEALHHWKPVKVELVNYKKNGELFWAELQLTPVQADGSDRFTHWIGVQRDITQRKQAEQTLHATSERLTLALEASSLGVWTQHVATRVNYRDKHWYVMLGYPPSDEPVSSTDWLSYVHPDDVARIQVHENDALASGESAFEHEFRMRHSSGRWVWISSRGRVIERDEAGQPLVIAGTHMDITDRVEARLATERLRGQGDSK
jgi:PAS domain S-box-containing protein